MFRTIILMAVAGAGPLIVRLAGVNYGPDYGNLSAWGFDCFWKAALVISAGLLLILLEGWFWIGRIRRRCRAYSREERTERSRHVMAAYSREERTERSRHVMAAYSREGRRGFQAGIWLMAGAIVAAWAASEYRLVAVVGYPNEYEGALVWLSYLALAWAASRLNGREKELVIRAMLIGAAGVGAIAAGQYFGHDIFRTKAGMWLIGAEGRDVKHVGGMVYATMYNSNYLGTYAAMIFALCYGRSAMLWRPTENEKSQRRNTIEVEITAGLMVFIGFVLIASGSRTGMLAAAAILIFDFGLWIVDWKKRRADGAGPPCYGGLQKMVLVSVIITGLALWMRPSMNVAQSVSERVEFWKATAPAMVETALVGKGPGTYAFYYPQGKKWVSKPHNMYIQVWLGIGGIGLAAMIYLAARAVRFGTPGVSAAVLAYMLAGVGNDSFVTVSPVFWILVGLGKREGRRSPATPLRRGGYEGRADGRADRRE